MVAVPFISIVLIALCTPLHSQQVEAAGCPKGKFAIDSRCKNCYPGYFNPFAGALHPGNCLSCPKNTFSKAGSAKCTACPPGHVSNKKASKCVFCGPGKQLVAPYDRRCSVCEKGTFKTAAMATCEKCPSGQTSDEVGATECTVCPAGTHRDVRFSASDKISRGGCFKCPKNTYASSEGTVQCAMCPLGTIARPGSTKCTSCPEGTFRSSVTMDTCKNCPRYSASKGSQPAGCKHRLKGCPFNTFEAAGGECRSCMPGERLNLEARTCEPCGANGVSLGGVQPYCEACPYGSHPAGSATIYEKATCECNPGWATDGYTGCIKCQAGTVTEWGPVLFDANNHRRQNFHHNSYCGYCNDGEYSDKAGLASCLKCPSGSVNDKAGATECTPCPPGSMVGIAETIEFSPRPSTEEVCLSLKENCEIGGKRDTNGNCQVESCPPDTFLDRFYGSCRQCEFGQRYSPSKNECLPCPTGFRGAVGYHINKICLPYNCKRTERILFGDCGCAPGRQRVGTKCVKCGKGLVAKDGQRGCTACPLNHVAVISSSKESCFPCSGRKYRKRSNDTECTKCPNLSVVGVDVLGDRMDRCMPRGGYYPKVE